MTIAGTRRRLSVGVELQETGEAHARVWAPACRSVDFVTDASSRRGTVAHPMTREPDGHFSGAIPDAGAGTRYWFRLDGARLRPDPVSRFQPEGPHGPSQIVDPSRFSWTDGNWRGPAPAGQVLYEMHVGTFTREGTWAAAAEQLPELAALGVTTIEMMPVADFPGRYGWGYDGVNLYAPANLYGTPDDLRAFVDRAHAAGLAVILDVVYNHLGPDGNYLAEFSPEYFTRKYKNDWGAALNFEEPPAARAFFVENAGYWIDEFHFDGLRLDATQDVHDASAEHVLASIARRAREAAGKRRVYLVAENEPQNRALVRRLSEGGFGFDAIWNDDYHHTARVALTGRREAYYTDYKGTPQELVSCAKYGFLYQGQWYSWQKKQRGTAALDYPHHTTIAYLENHDQIANTGFGRRLHQISGPGRFRAITALTLLGPWTPLLFQGQEFSSSAPFLYFMDHREELRKPVCDGRREFLSQFPSLSNASVDRWIASPADEETFRRCKLDFAERHLNAKAYALHRDLLALRRSDRTLAAAGSGRVDGAVLASEAFALRYFDDDAGDRLLIVNLGCDLELSPMPEPLLAPPDGSRWVLVWSSESPSYGGEGIPPMDPAGEWRLTGESASFWKADHEQQ